MRVRPAITVLLCLTLVVGIGSAVYAQSVSECQALITALRFKVQSVQIIGRNAAKDRSGLIGKLDAAADKLDKAKFCDAIQKLNDFEAKVQELADAGKLTLEDAAELTRDVTLAIGCIQGVATSAGIGCGA